MELVETPVSPAIIVSSVSFNQSLLHGVPKKTVKQDFFGGHPVLLPWMIVLKTEDR